VTKTPILHALVLATMLACPAARADVLPNDFLIYGTPYFENTARVIAPSKINPLGEIVVVTGSPRDQANPLYRPLMSAMGGFDTTSTASASAFPYGNTRAPGTDNQIVRLKDGSLLAEKDCYIWDPIPTNPPPWIKERITGSSEHDGQRSGPILFRSTDSGKTWVVQSVIDLGTFAGGKYGVPRAMDDQNNIIRDPKTKQGVWSDGKLKWYVGGCDRTEIYGCPFTGNVYLATTCGGGPYNNLPYTNTLMLLFSKDQGKTWEIVKDDFPAWAPLVMTSTPNGRLFLFQCVGDQPMVYYAKNPGAAGVKPVISSGFKVNYMENGKPVPNGMDPSSGNNPLDLLAQAYHPSISRVSTETGPSKVRVSYHSVNANGREEARIMLIDVGRGDHAPTVKPLKTIRSHDPSQYSVVYGTFVDPDYLSMPAGTKSNASVFYWLEAPKQGLKMRQYSARYVVFEGETNCTCPAFLSMKDGKPRTWSNRQDLGDYMSGGFFWNDNKLNYLCQWVDDSGIRANIVTVPYQTPSETPHINVTAVWERSTDEEVEVYDVTRVEYLQRCEVLAKQGWRLHLLSNRMFNDEIRYSAVWRKSTVEEIQEVDATYKTFRARYDGLWKDGWRLHLLANCELHGEVRYTAVFRKDKTEEMQDYAVPYKEFRKHYDDLWNKNWRLHILNTFVADGEVRYTAIWRPENTAEMQVYGVPYADYRKEYDKLSKDGWRLHLLSSCTLDNQVLYTAVWRQSKASETQVERDNFPDFKHRDNDLRCAGWRLKLLEVADSGGKLFTDPVIYHVKMITVVRIPDRKVEDLQVYHGLPALRPWSNSGNKYGATDVKFDAGGMEQHSKKYDSYEIVWNVRDNLKPGTVHRFNSEFSVRSGQREFVPDKFHIQWKDYTQKLPDPAAKLDPDVLKNLNPEIVALAESAKKTQSPAHAVLWFCKWLHTNITYDASVSYPPSDVASTLKNHRGHCGHKAILLEQFCTACGIPFRTVWGLNLYAPNGKGELSAIRADYVNIHTWAEVYFPGVGWIEVEPDGADRAFVIGAQYIQNNRWFQNYNVIVRENGQVKSPTWTYQNGRYVSDYGLENLITYTVEKK
jgi:hypothetical protein